MRSLLICALAAGLVFGLAPTSSEAKRLGGGKSYGMQRNTPDKPAQAPQSPPATPNAPAAAAAPTAGAAAAAAAPKRSWMGPIAGLAAGLGLAALLGHFGLGAEFANLLMFALLAVVAVVVIRLLMRRFAGGTANGRGLAYAGGAGSSPVGNGLAGDGAGRVPAPTLESLKVASPPALPGSAAASWGSSTGAGSRLAEPVAGATAIGASRPVALPPGFDTAAFERIAKTIFIRLQAANDAGDLNDLRNFTTPELFAELRLDLQERGGAAQQTDVVTVEAKVLDCAEEADRQIVSVHFQGLMREAADTEATPFDEVWHLVKPVDGSRPWAIAGVQQRQ
jgi:predicted lipid-binding transport protein (Tim44 family)